jgi:HEAT repeat protein
LVTIGGKSVAALSDALEGKNEGQRWEAAKALGQIGDPAAVGVLVKTLEDKIFDLRWLAAEGLISIGRPSIVPLLHRLIEKTDSVWVREGAHHVFHDLHDPKSKIILRPVLDALEDSDTHIQIPFAAEAALKSLE